MATIIGTLNDDILDGTAQSDLIQGLAGNDIILGNGGGDILDGGLGFDTVSYSWSTLGVVLDITCWDCPAGSPLGS